MTEIFVDTSFWIAYLDRSDRFHAAAAPLISASHVSHRLFTTNFVLHESLLHKGKNAHTVILNEVKNLICSIGYEILRFAQDDKRGFVQQAHETLTYLNCSLKAHAQAVAYLHTTSAAARDGFLTLVRIDEAREKAALDLFVQYQDKAFSVVDCSSFIVMRERSIERALAFDDHFRQMGFRLLPHV